MRPLILVPFLAAAALAACGDADRPDDIVDPARGETIPRIVPAEEALASVHVPSLDPATMTRAEIDKALGAQTLCVFRYTSEARPVLRRTGWKPATSASWSRRWRARTAGPR